MTPFDFEVQFLSILSLNRFINCGHQGRYYLVILVITIILKLDNQVYSPFHCCMMGALMFHWRDIISRYAHLVHKNGYRISFTFEIFHYHDYWNRYLTFSQKLSIELESVWMAFDCYTCLYIYIYKAPDTCPYPYFNVPTTYPRQSFIHDVCQRDPRQRIAVRLYRENYVGM
jgi:hypothetical protein